MRISTATAMLLGLFAFAVAPTAEARHDDDRRGDRYERRHYEDRYDRGDRHDARRPLDRRDLRELTFRLENATDALVRDAERATGLPNRREAKALRAIRRLELATDDLAREARERHLDRGYVKDLRRVVRRWETVRDRAYALPHSRRIDRDLRRVDRLIAKLERRTGDWHDRVAWYDAHYGRFARR